MNPDKQSVLEELGRITASEGFRTKPVMRKLLRYLVTEYVEGRSDKIKGYSIALDVFGKQGDFDPDRSVLVRNNAVRLRGLLKTYYLGEGRNNPLSMEIPKGRYVPHFSCIEKEAKCPADVKSLLAQSLADLEEVLPPTVGVQPFRENAVDPKIHYLVSGWSRELVDALTKFEFRVIALDRSDTPRQNDVDYLIDGDVAALGSLVKIHFRLKNTADHSQLWGDTIKFDVDRDNLFDVQERITGRIASLVGGEFGQINQHRYKVMQASRPTSITEQDLLLKHYHQVLVLTDESVTDFYQDVMQAHEKHPESAVITSLASSIYNNIWMYSGTDGDEALQEFARLAEEAYQLNPNHQVVLSTLAGKCFHFDERERFFALFQQSKEWMANSPLRLGSWAMYMCFFGEWDLGKKLLDMVFENNLNVPLWLHGVACAYYVRSSDYEAALEEANRYQIQGLFWGPAYRCAVLGHLGRADEAREQFDTLLDWRPDFVENGRRLMGRLYKESDLLDHVFEGFNKVGVSIA